MKRNAVSDEFSMNKPVRRARSPARAAGMLVALLALAGCGFHMQGASPLPNGVKAVQVFYKNNYDVGDPPVVTALKQRLRRQHVLGGVHAPAKLDIVSVVNRQRVVSVSPLGGYVAEYALTSEVTFNYRVHGAKRLSGQHLSLTRNYTVDDAQKLSDELEYHRMLANLQQDLAGMILERITQTRDHSPTSASAGKPSTP